MRASNILLAAMVGACVAVTAMASSCSTRTDASRPPTEPSRPAGAATETPGSGAAVPRELSVEDQVREAVFRHQFAHNSSGQKDRAPIYFLSLGETDKPQDPSPALMARFAQHQPRVEPVSRAHVSFDSSVRHRDTGERGLIFRVTSIERVSDDLAIVEGGYYEGNLSSSGNTYRVERKNGVWVVTDDKMQWIS